MSTSLYERDDARQLLDTELSDSAYQRPFAGPLRDALNDLLSWLAEVRVPIGGFDVPFGPVLVLAAAVAAVVITLLVVRPRLQRAAHREAAVDIDPQISAEQLRIRAAEHAADGHFGPAAQDAFRALVRGAEEQGTLPVQNGRTATEIANTLGHSFAEQSGGLRHAADIFNRSAYGSAPLTEADYQFICRLGSDLQTVTAP